MSAAATIRELRDIAAAGRPVALSPAALTQLVAYVETAEAQYAEAVAAAQDVADASASRARAHLSEAREHLVRSDLDLTKARRMRRHCWYLLAMQVGWFLAWAVGLWGWG